MDFKRSDRLESLIKEVIASALRFDVKDPRIGEVSITDVRMNRDNSIARVYFVPFASGKEHEEVLEGLLSARGFLRGRLGRQMKSKRTPDLHFHYDESYDYAAKMAPLFEKISDSSDNQHD